MLKTKVKELKALETAKLEAELKWREKHLLQLAKQNIAEKISDPDEALKFVSIFGVALIIKNGIDWTEKLKAGVPQWAWMASPLLGLFSKVIPEDSADPLSPSEVSEWLISLAIAYLIVNNFGEIMRGVNSALSIVSMAVALL